MQSDTQIQYNTCQSSNNIFAELKRAILKLISTHLMHLGCFQILGSLNNQNGLEKEGQKCMTHTSLL